MKRLILPQELNLRTKIFKLDNIGCTNGCVGAEYRQHNPIQRVFRIYEDILTYGGYVSVADTVYHWYMTDYQGNISGVVNTATKELEQYQDYHPYGKPHDTAVDASDNRRKFGGKELITDKGYEAYDFEARPLTLTIPRFSQPDNKAETYYPTSIYVYCGGDPINRIDPTGEEW